MPLSTLYNLKKEKVGTINLPDNMFDLQADPFIINYAVRGNIARKYILKTAKAKTRSEVKGTTAKVYRQKGTGRARHGALTAPIFVGGGKAFGPQKRIRSYKTNKKLMSKAILSLLSTYNREERFFIIDKLEFDKCSTKEAVSFLSKVLNLNSALVINDSENEGEKNFNKSISNIAWAKQIPPQKINVFDLLKYKNLVCSSKAADKIMERFKKWS